MSDLTTRTMIEAYMDDAPPQGFLSSFFRAPPRNFYNSARVEYDVIRNNRTVAVAVSSLAAGSNVNEKTLYTNKDFEAPVMRESAPVATAIDLLNRMPGDDPFASVDFQTKLTFLALTQARELEAMIRRSIETQCSQVFQSGTVTLGDAAGDTVYSIDYSPKATHFFDSAVDWATSATATPLIDLAKACNLIRVNGKTEPTDVIFGETAFLNFIRTAEVQNLSDNRRINQGTIAPTSRTGRGAIFQGTISVGNYVLRLWTYADSFDDIVTGADTPYVTTTNAIILSEAAPLEATFGAVPRVVAPDARVSQFMPRRMQNSSEPIDLWPYVWTPANGSAIFVELASRPLMIPKAIDSFARIDTTGP